MKSGKSREDDESRDAQDYDKTLRVKLLGQITEG